jgi:hypothetical protein
VYNLCAGGYSVFPLGHLNKTVDFSTKRGVTRYNEHGCEYYKTNKNQRLKCTVKGASSDFEWISPFFYFGYSTDSERYSTKNCGISLSGIVCLDFDSLNSPVTQLLLHVLTTLNGGTLSCPVVRTPGSDKHGSGLHLFFSGSNLLNRSKPCISGALDIKTGASSYVVSYDSCRNTGRYELIDNSNNTLENYIEPTYSVQNGNFTLIPKSELPLLPEICEKFLLLVGSNENIILSTRLFNVFEALQLQFTNETFQNRIQTCIDIVASYQLEHEPQIEPVVSKVEPVNELSTGHEIASYQLGHEPQIEPVVSKVKPVTGVVEPVNELSTGRKNSGVLKKGRKKRKKCKRSTKRLERRYSNDKYANVTLEQMVNLLESKYAGKHGSGYDLFAHAAGFLAYVANWRGLDFAYECMEEFCSSIGLKQTFSQMCKKIDEFYYKDVDTHEPENMNETRTNNSDWFLQNALITEMAAIVVNKTKTETEQEYHTKVTEKERSIRATIDHEVDVIIGTKVKKEKESESEFQKRIKAVQNKLKWARINQKLLELKHNVDLTVYLDNYARTNVKVLLEYCSYNWTFDPSPESTEFYNITEFKRKIMKCSPSENYSYSQIISNVFCRLRNNAFYKTNGNKKLTFSERHVKGNTRSVIQGLSCTPKTKTELRKINDNLELFLNGRYDCGTIFDVQTHSTNNTIPTHNSQEYTPLRATFTFDADYSDFGRYLFVAVGKPFSECVKTYFSNKQPLIEHSG